MSIADKLTQIAENEQKVYDAGYERGKAEGGDTTAAYEQGVADGKKSEYDAFWDAYQQNGNREDYSHAFGGIGWNNWTFKPKYDIKPNSSYMIFRQCGFDGDLVDCLDNLGVTLDFSNTINTAYMFAIASKITHIGEIDVRNSTTATVFDACFQNCSALKTIDKLKFKKGKTGEFSTSSFSSCFALENITMEGEIANNGLNLQYSPKLSRASIESVINALSDTTTGKSVTLSKTAVENAFSESEKTTIPFGFDTSYEGINVTAIDNGDGTVTVNGFVSDDVEFNYEDAVGTFTAGSYIISVPEIDCGYVGFECYDLDGNKLTAEYAGDYTWALNTDKSFVVKACVYLQYGEYTDYVIPYPTIQLANSFDALIATKPNWTINLV